MNEKLLKKNEKKGYFFVFIAVVMWSSSEILQKLLQDAVPPMSKSFFRFFLGTISLIIILILQKDLKMKNLFRRNAKLLIFIGVIPLAIGNFIYFMGVVRTQANIASVIYGSYPIIISVYSIFILNERDNLSRRAVGYVIGFVTILVLVTEGDLQGLINSENIAGNLLVLLGALIWSLFSVLGKLITNKERVLVKNIDLKFNILTMGIACIMNLILIFFMPEESLTFFNYDGKTWILLLLLGVITTGISNYLFFAGIRYIEVSKGISLAMIKPIIVMIFAFLILGEIPTLLLVFSIPLVLFAIFIVTKK